MTPRLLIPLLLLLSAWTDTRAGMIESSYRQARETVERSLESLGAASWPESAQAILIEAEGTWNLDAEHQGRRPGVETPAPFRETWAWDPDTGQVGREYRIDRPDGSVEWIRELFPEPGQRLILLMDQKTRVEMPGEAASASRGRTLRRFPPLLLQEALENAASLRATGHFGPFMSVQMQTREQETLSLFFGRESRDLAVIEYLAHLPTFSDTTVSWAFSNYRPAGAGLRLPRRYTVRVGEQAVADMAVSRVSMDQTEVREFLEPPEEGWRRIHNPGTRGDAIHAGARVEQPAPGVFRIVGLRPGFHALFVEFEDFVLAVDAPSGYPLLMELPAGDVAEGLSESALSAHVLQLIRDTVGPKPVRHLVITHFHSDHAGGLLAFADRGIELHVAASETEAVQQFLDQTHTLCPNEDHSDRAFNLSALDRPRVISDTKGQRVEILPAGHNPHTEQMLLVWLPGPAILWVADLAQGLDAGEVGDAWIGRWLERNPDVRPEWIFRAHDTPLELPESMHVNAQQTLESPRNH